MVLAVAFFVTVAWLAREIQGMRERTSGERVLADLRLSQTNVRQGVRRLAEDFFVMQHLLAERGVVAESELMRGRARLIDAPRRKAQEKRAMTQHLGGLKPHLVVEDHEGNLH